MTLFPMEVLWAAGISIVLLLLLLLLFVYYRHPQFCKQLCTGSDQYLDHPPAFFCRTNQGNTRDDQLDGNSVMQENPVFCVGPPSTYCLPSYDSVREKDRQLGIQKLILEKCDLNWTPTLEAPPSYAESVRTPPPPYCV